jgi:hypothetical protein
MKYSSTASLQAERLSALLRFCDKYFSKLEDSNAARNDVALHLLFYTRAAVST